jgi:hypothetical protein
MQIVALNRCSCRSIAPTDCLINGISFASTFAFVDDFGRAGAVFFFARCADGFLAGAFDVFFSDRFNGFRFCLSLTLRFFPLALLDFTLAFFFFAFVFVFFTAPCRTCALFFFALPNDDVVLFGALLFLAAIRLDMIMTRLVQSTSKQNNDNKTNRYGLIFARRI